MNQVFFLRTITNLHVGSENSENSIIDKIVQRDSCTNTPVIKASSFKGALKDFLKDHLSTVTDENSNGLLEKYYKSFFGSESESSLINFYDSFLLFIPLRSNIKPFFNVTSKDALYQFLDFYELFFKDNEELNERINKAREEVKSLEDGNYVFSNKDAMIEDVYCTTKENIDIDNLLSLFPENYLLKNHIAVFSNENFFDICDNLPIVARNNLENKVSTNVWYEELIPRQAIFYGFMDISEYIGNRIKYGYENGWKSLFRIIEDNNIQIGSNESIGYGLTNIKIGKQINEK